MSIAITVNSALRENDIEYHILRHPHSRHSAESAEAAHVSGEQVAKAVLLKDQHGFLLAVLPATHVLDLQRLGRLLHRSLRLASEQELENNFYDCETGAVPALGPWYCLPTVVDSSLRRQPDIFFEAGDHQRLIHVKETAFERLMQGAEYLDISEHLG
jgi:Ala-tRNA(Pro) deacylase